MAGLKPPAIPEGACRSAPTSSAVTTAQLYETARALTIGGTPPSSDSSSTPACACQSWLDSPSTILILTRTSPWSSARAGVPAPVRSGTRPVRPWSATLRGSGGSIGLPAALTSGLGPAASYRTTASTRCSGDGPGRQASRTCTHTCSGHTFAHRWLAEGGQEQDLMRLAGWRSKETLARYGASAADQRARDAHRRMRPGDRYHPRLRSVFYAFTRRELRKPES